MTNTNIVYRSAGIAAVHRSAGFLREVGLLGAEEPTITYAARLATAYLCGVRAYWPDRSGRVVFSGGYEGVGAREWSRLQCAADLINTYVDLIDADAEETP